MKKLLLIILICVLISGCGIRVDSPSIVESNDEITTLYTTYNINVIHDNVRNVTCWVYSAGYAGGISCIPDMYLP